MNNWRRFEERVNVWVLRFSTEAVLLYWGVTNMSPTDASQVLSLMKVRSEHLHKSSVEPVSLPIESHQDAFEFNYRGYMTACR